MSHLAEQLARYKKMAEETPDNELAFFRLGQLLLEDSQLEEAAKAFRKTLALSPQFSKVYQLLGTALIKLNRKDEAVEVLNEGFHIADSRGDNIPRDEMTKLLTGLGQPAPVSRKAAAKAGGAATGDGFHCQRPGCIAGDYARKLPKAPMNDELGQKIFDTVCADCWEYWFKNMSIKVINEMHLDLSTEKGQDQYDRIMRDTLGLT